MAGKKECDSDCGVVKVAVYARLSVNEHGERDDSLNTQRSILTEYVKSQGLAEPIIYEDSDISGTCFDRPGCDPLLKKGVRPCKIARPDSFF